MNRSPELIPGAMALHCSHCDWQQESTQESVSSQAMSHCLVCQNEDLWRQKDFPQSLGVACVALGAILSGIAVYYYRPFLAMGILMAFGLLDMVLFLVMPDVLVCYRCQSRHGGLDTSTSKEFDLELSERYRQEAFRRRGFEEEQRKEKNVPVS